LASRSPATTIKGSEYMEGTQALLYDCSAGI